MFVAIDNKDMNEQNIDKWIKNTRDDNGGITPDFAMEVLSKTNHIANIKTVIRNIKAQCIDENKKLVPELVLPYRDFILSCVDEREQSKMVMADLCELAEACGCKDELDAINNEPKLYRLRDCQGITVNSSEEFSDLEYPLVTPSMNVFLNFDCFDRYGLDFRDYKALKFRDNSSIHLRAAEHFREGLDFSMCSVVDLGYADLENVENLKFREGAVVDLSGVKNMPHDVDVASCSRIELSECDLSVIDNLKFRDMSSVILEKAYNLPENLDVSMCHKVVLSGCDLSGLKNLKFRKGAIVEFYTSRYNFFTDTDKFPEVLDFSGCDRVDLTDCDVSNVKELKFGDNTRLDLACIKGLKGVLDFSTCIDINMKACNLQNVTDMKFGRKAIVDLRSAENFPEVLDFSQCSKVDLTNCKFNGVKEIKFGEGSNIDLWNASALPEVLDLSMCSNVRMTRCDLTGVKEIKFKNKEQARAFLDDASNVLCDIDYVEDKEKITTLPVNGGFDM